MKFNEEDYLTIPNRQLTGFYSPESGTIKGINIREYFTVMATQGLISDHTFIRPDEIEEIAIRSVAIADALIRELNK